MSANLKLRIENLFLEAEDKQKISYNNWRFYTVAKNSIYEILIRMKGQEMHNLLNSLDVKVKTIVQMEFQMFLIHRTGRFVCTHNWIFFKDEKIKACQRCLVTEEISGK